MAVEFHPKVELRSGSTAHGALSVIVDLTRRMPELSVQCLDSAGNTIFNEPKPVLLEQRNNINMNCLYIISFFLLSLFLFFFLFFLSFFLAFNNMPGNE